MSERILTNRELAEREAAWGANYRSGIASDDTFCIVAVDQEPALLARLKRAEALLRKTSESLLPFDSQWGREVRAHFAEVEGAGDAKHTP